MTPTATPSSSATARWRSSPNCRRSPAPSSTRCGARPARRPASTTARIPPPGPLTLPPPRHGTRIRFVDIPPETPELFGRDADALRAGFSEIGDAAASTAHAGAPHPLMHRTETVDYGIVIESELTLVLDRGEVQLRPGSVVVQRGTNHAWANRSGKPCRMLFVLVDGSYEPDLAKALASRA